MRSEDFAALDSLDKDNPSSFQADGFRGMVSQGMELELGQSELKVTCDMLQRSESSAYREGRSWKTLSCDFPDDVEELLQSSLKMSWRELAVGARRPIVFLLHGIFGTSARWTLGPPDKVVVATFAAVAPLMLMLTFSIAFPLLVLGVHPC